MQTKTKRVNIATYEKTLVLLKTLCDIIDFQKEMGASGLAMEKMKKVKMITLQVIKDLK